MSMQLDRADFGWIAVDIDARFIADDYGNAVHIPFSAPLWSLSDFEEI